MRCPFCGTETYLSPVKSADGAASGRARAGSGRRVPARPGGHPRRRTRRRPRREAARLRRRRIPHRRGSRPGSSPQVRGETPVMRLAYKIWLDYRGRAFGDGPARLLDGVERAGSLRKAATELGMSYNKAWRILHAAEQRLGFALLDRSVGGSLGGGSHLTPRPRTWSALPGPGGRGRGGPRRRVRAALLRLGGPRARGAAYGASARGLTQIGRGRRGMASRPPDLPARRPISRCVTRSSPGAVARACRRGPRTPSQAVTPSAAGFFS